jgi:hypothetical protein
MTITTPTIPATRQLPTDLLEGFRSRAGALDRANDYFHEDLAELR